MVPPPDCAWLTRLLLNRLWLVRSQGIVSVEWPSAITSIADSLVVWIAFDLELPAIVCDYPQSLADKTGFSLALALALLAAPLLTYALVRLGAWALSLCGAVRFEAVRDSYTTIGSGLRHTSGQSRTGLSRSHGPLRPRVPPGA